MEYDVIIMGAGLSALAAGIRLVHYGKRVRIFESHVLPGGLNSWFMRGGHCWDTGLHAMTNFVPEGNRSAPLPLMLRQLRLKRSELDLVPQSRSVIRFPGCELVLDNDFTHFRQQIATLFPADLAGFDELCARLMPYGAYSTTVQPASTRAVLAELLPTPLLREMLLCPVLFYGSPAPHDLDFGRFSVLFQSIFQEGFMRPRNGMRPFIESLVNKYTGEGGELSLGCGIASIQTEQGRVISVTDTTGAIHHAAQYMSCAGCRETMLLAQPEIPLAQQDAVAPESPIGFLETIFSLRCPPAELGMQECIVFQNDAEKFNFVSPTSKPASFESCLICCPGNYQGCQNIPDANTLRYSVLASPNFWLNTSEPLYRSAKQEIVELCLQKLEAMYPGFRKQVQFTDMFTPRTFRRFTRHCNGAIYGSSRKSPTGASPWSNLSLIGADQGLLGIVGSMISGMTGANSLLV